MYTDILIHNNYSRFTFANTVYNVLRQPLARSSVVVAVNCSTYLPICSATFNFVFVAYGCWDWEAFIFRYSVALFHDVMGGAVFLGNTIIIFAIGGFTMTSNAVSRGRLAPLVGKSFGYQAWRAFCRDSILVCLHFTHTHDHDFVLYWCGVHWTLCGRPVLCCYHPKQGKTKKNLVECVQL